jgi:hypothetical protein
VRLHQQEETACFGKRLLLAGISVFRWMNSIVSKVAQVRGVRKQFSDDSSLAARARKDVAYQTLNLRSLVVCDRSCQCWVLRLQRASDAVKWRPTTISPNW